MPLLLALAALAASVLLLVQSRARLLPLVALGASGVQVLLGFGVLRLDLRGVPLGLVLSSALAVAGVLLYLRAGGKPATAASTAVALVGAVQVLAALRLLG
jgi:hypothetical protein